MKDPRKFPLYTSSAKTGNAGVMLVQRIIGDEFGWIMRTVPQQLDFGIDAYVEVVTASGEVTGRFIALQIKCGDTYVAKRTKDGFMYLGEMKHLNYYMNHPIPVILILCDPKTMTCWWELFDPNRTTPRTGGWSIAVPSDQYLGLSAKRIFEALAGPVNDFSEDVEFFWEMNNFISEQTNWISLVVTRKEIEALETRNIVEFAHRLQVTPELTRRSRHKVNLSIHGYDDDPRELWEIPDVRAWFEAIEKFELPWFWFLNPHPMAYGLVLLLFCLCPVKTIGARTVEISLEERLRFFETQFSRFNRVAAQVRLTQLEGEAASTDIINYYSRLIPPS